MIGSKGNLRGDGSLKDQLIETASDLVSGKPLSDKQGLGSHCSGKQSLLGGQLKVARCSLEFYRYLLCILSCKHQTLSPGKGGTFPMAVR